MKDFKVSPGATADSASDIVSRVAAFAAPLDRTLINHRLSELERRVGRIEAFLLGGLSTIALSVLGGLVALLNLPA
ncbi:MAG: hypothetical protein NXI19_20090 [Alphaproteobacteria bacterium]|nr:hypothetical protein [Alphaproteobacteria bacterium]